MIVNPQLSVDYDFTELNAKLPANLQVTDIYDYYRKLEDIKGALTLTDLGFLYAPLKEPYFRIDANSRNITVPDIFRTNGIGVEGDHYAETICFQVDRYFDTMDLTNTDVYIHWILNDGGLTDDNQIKEGKDNAYFVDPVASKNYLVIGWPLNKKKFAESGNLKFYVSFEVTNDDDTIYVLNTLPATVKINTKLKLEQEVADETDYDNFPYISGTITNIEMANPPATSLIYDIQPVTNNGLSKDISGPRKEIIDENGLTVAAKFKNDSGSILETYMVKDGTPIEITPTVDGTVSYSITTPGSYYFTAQPKYGTSVNAPANEVVKSSTIIVMNPMKPIFGEIEYAKTLPAGVTEVDHKVIYLNDTQKNDDVLVTMTINNLDYSTDTSTMSHNAKDYGAFMLVPYWEVASPDADYEPLHKEVGYEFNGKTLTLTKAQLTQIKTDRDDTSKQAYTLKVVHTLNNVDNVIDSPIDVNGITTTIVPLFLTSLRNTNSLTLSITNGSFILTKSIVGGYTSEWQYYNGKTWVTERNVTGDIWALGQSLGSYSLINNTTFEEKHKIGLINTIKDNYRINLINIANLTKTQSITPGNAQLDPETDFYDIIIDTSVIPVEDNG